MNIFHFRFTQIMYFAFPLYQALVGLGSLWRNLSLIDTNSN